MARRRVIPPGETVAVDGGYNRFPNLEATVKNLLILGLPEAPLLLLPWDGLLEVGASGEGAVAGAGDDGAPDIGVIPDVDPSLGKRLIHLGVHGVHDLGAVQGDIGDFAFLFIYPGTCRGLLAGGGGVGARGLNLGKVISSVTSSHTTSTERPGSDVVVVDLYQVGEQSGAFFKLDDSDVVRQVVLEGSAVALVHDYPGVNGPAP